MTSNYDFAFDEVRNQITHYSPRVVPILEHLKQAYSAQIAYYAGFILVCIQAQQNIGYHKALDTLTKTDLHDFAFFEQVKDDQTAITLFDELLRTYVTEQTHT